MNARPGFIGKAVERTEDARFLTGKGQTYARFLRSPCAHARIRKLDASAAQAAPGMRGIFTGEHCKAVGGLPCHNISSLADRDRHLGPVHASASARYPEHHRQPKEPPCNSATSKPCPWA